MRPKKPLANVAMQLAPVLIPSQRPFATSVSSVMLVANDKGAVEMIPGAVQKPRGICLMAEENLS